MELSADVIPALIEEILFVIVPAVLPDLSCPFGRVGEITVMDVFVAAGIVIRNNSIEIAEGEVLDNIAVRGQGLRIVPDLGLLEQCAGIIRICRDILFAAEPEIRHDRVIQLAVTLQLNIEIILCLAIGGADIVPVLFKFLVRIVIKKGLGRLIVIIIGAERHRARCADLRIIVRVNIKIVLVAQLQVAAEQTVVIETFIACFLFAALVHEYECAVAVAVGDLDSAVLNQLLAEGIGAEIDHAGRAGEFAEMRIVILVSDSNVLQVIEAAECTAAHLHVCSVDRHRLDIFAGIEIKLILIIENQIAGGFFDAQRFRLRFTLAVADPCCRGLVQHIGTHEVKDIRAAVAFKETVIDIGDASHILPLIPGFRRAWCIDNLNNRIAGVRRGAVAHVFAAVGDKGAVCADLDDRTHDCLRDTALFVRAAHFGNLITQTECAVHDLADRGSVGCLVDNIILRFGKLCFLALLVLVGFRCSVLVGLIRLLAALLAVLCSFFFLFADSLVPFLLGIRILHLGLIMQIAGFAVLLYDIGFTLGKVFVLGAVCLRLLIFGRAVLYLSDLFKDIVILSRSKIDTGCVFRDADSHFNGGADRGQQLAPGEIVLDADLSSARLEGAAVDDQIAVVDIEHISGRIHVNIMVKGIDHIAGEFERSGTLAVVLTAPCRGVDDCQRRAVFNLKCPFILRIGAGMVLIPVVIVFAVAVKLHINGVTV